MEFLFDGIDLTLPAFLDRRGRRGDKRNAGRNNNSGVKLDRISKAVYSQGFAAAKCGLSPLLFVDWNSSDGDGPPLAGSLLQVPSTSEIATSVAYLIQRNYHVVAHALLCESVPDRRRKLQSRFGHAAQGILSTNNRVPSWITNSSTAYAGGCCVVDPCGTSKGVNRESLAELARLIPKLDFVIVPNFGCAPRVLAAKHTKAQAEQFYDPMAWAELLARRYVAIDKHKTKASPLHSFRLFIVTNYLAHHVGKKAGQYEIHSLR